MHAGGPDGDASSTDVGSVIEHLRVSGRAERRVVDLSVPVPVWRRLLTRAAMAAGLLVDSYLVPAVVDPSTEAEQQIVVVLLAGTHPPSPPDPCV
jgi:hypothetical protein